MLFRSTYNSYKDNLVNCLNFFYLQNRILFEMKHIRKIELDGCIEGIRVSKILILDDVIRIHRISQGT